MVTCEPVGRLIRMTRFECQNGLGTAHNAFPKREFIRGSDPYFRPVWTENGPDGCLYIADMYRGIIQEKEWFPTEIDPSIKDWRKDRLSTWVARYTRVKKWGMTKVVRHGCIYRVVPDDKQPGPRPRMLDKTPAQRVAHLTHTNGWWRDTAQMLLVGKREAGIGPALIEMARSHTNINARIHALWTLDGLKLLPKDLLLASLKHQHSRVWRTAVHIGEQLLARQDSDIRAAIHDLADDPDSSVLAQVYLACQRAKMPITAALTAQSTSQPLLAALIDKGKSAESLARLGASAKEEREIYQTLCTTCHGPDGLGMKAGEKLLAPALSKSSWFKNNGDIPTLARILLHGQTGPIDGITYGEGLMLPLAQIYNDPQIASVLNYIGERWQGWKTPVSADAIKAIRAETTDRTTPWTPQELKARLNTP